MSETPLPPDFRSPEVLRQQALHALAFYDGRALDPSGGLFQFFKDDGTVYDAHTRHLVSSTRYVLTFAEMARHCPDHPRAGAWRDTAAHALDFVRRVHLDPDHGGYTWLLRWQDGRAERLDTTQQAYGLAFVLLAHARAARLDLPGARQGIAETFELMERRFWEPAAGLYADEATRDWQVGPYRGQNANMHACEALLAAFEATGEARYLQRAAVLAESVTGRLAAASQGLVWEHFKPDWTPDWDYNRHDRSNIFRPWGFQTGHQTEWAKLLLVLDRLEGRGPGADTPRLARARALFDAAMRHGWDAAHGGLVYGFAPAGCPADDPVQQVCDGDKYHWVQAESLAAAALLWRHSGDAAFLEAYQRLWAYVWAHFVDHRHGAWFRILAPDNRAITSDKSPAGKVDYHNIGACLDAATALGT